MADGQSEWNCLACPWQFSALVLPGCPGILFWTRVILHAVFLSFSSMKVSNSWVRPVFKNVQPDTKLDGGTQIQNNSWAVQKSKSKAVFC